MTQGGSGIGDQELSLRADAAHETSVAIWDLISPVVVGRRATLKIGVACSSGCDLSGTSVDVRNKAGARVGRGTLGSAPWPATNGLYWTTLEVAAPEAEGDHAWSVHATPPEPMHQQATSVVPFIACGSPEHPVTLHVVDKTSGAPLAAVELRLGVFRTATNDAGNACVVLPRGTYDVGCWKYGYEMASKTVVIAADAIIHVEMTAAREPEQPYWM